MVGGGVPRLVQNDSARQLYGRQLYSVRGVVKGHGERESGWWIFKTKRPVIRVRINEDQLVAFNRITCEHMRTQHGHLKGIAPILNLGMTEEETKEYPAGSEVGITLGYSGPIDQFFTGATPLKVMKLQVMHPGDQIDNEVPAPAACA